MAGEHTDAGIERCLSVAVVTVVTGQGEAARESLGEGLLAFGLMHTGTQTHRHTETRDILRRRQRETECGSCR